MRCSRSATPPSRRSARRPHAVDLRSPRSRTATTSASSRPVTPGRSSAPHRRAPRRRGRRRRNGARRTRRRARLHHRPAQGSRHRRPGPRRAPPLRDGHRRRHRDRARRRRRRPRGVDADRRETRCSPRASRRADPWSASVQVRAHGGIAEAVAEVRDGDLVVDLRAPLLGVAPRARPWCSTAPTPTATK